MQRIAMVVVTILVVGCAAEQPLDVGRASFELSPNTPECSGAGDVGVGGHMHPSSTIDAIDGCWEYSPGDTVTVASTYQTLSSANHGYEFHAWVLKGYDMQDEVGQMDTIAGAWRYADTWYTDTIKFVMPSTLERLRLGHNTDDELGLNMYVIAWRELAAPAAVTSQLLTRTISRVSWQNTSSPAVPAWTTIAERRLGTGSWSSVSTVASTTTFVDDSNVASGVETEYRVRHRHATGVDHGGSEVIRLSDWVSVDLLQAPIGGADSVTSGQTCMWYSIESGGTGVYSFEWRRREGKGPWQTIPDTISTYSEVVGDGNTGFSLILKVTSGPASVSDTFGVVVLPDTGLVLGC